MTEARGERQCVRCQTGRLEQGTTTATIERDETTVVFKDVPARVCRQCGESYLSGDVVDRLQEEFESAYEAGIIVDVRRWRSGTGMDAPSAVEHA